jgi:hypothetical protein
MSVSGDSKNELGFEWANRRTTTTLFPSFIQKIGALKWELVGFPVISNYGNDVIVYVFKRRKSEEVDC